MGKSRLEAVTPIFRGAVQSAHWQQSGSVWLWRYRGSDKNYPGWHLTADRTGAASLIQLLDIFANSNEPVFRTVQLGHPTVAIRSVPNNRNADWTAPVKLRIGLAADPNEWVLTCTDATAQLTLGLDWCPIFRQAVARIALGEGDFSIGPPDRSQRLGLWWYPLE
jgi:hypothetical protein